MTEIWKDIDIEGFEGLYRISNYGRLLSLNYRNTGKSHIVAKSHDSYGYELVHLYSKGKRYTIHCHRLVAMYFVPNPHKYKYVNHKDENPSNSRADNLEWCTCKYNYWYTRSRHENEYNFQEWTAKRRFSPRKHTDKIEQIDRDGHVIRIWDNVSQIHNETGYKGSSIISCCKKEKRFKTAYGYKWQYAN